MEIDLNKKKLVWNSWLESEVSEFVPHSTEESIFESEVDDQTCGWPLGHFLKASSLVFTLAFVGKAFIVEQCALQSFCM